MGQHTLDVIAHTVQVTNVWLKELAEAMDWHDRHRSYRLLRATLHALRDWLPTNESAHLSAQLPMLVRGIYYEGWHPVQTPAHPRDRHAFFERVETAMQPDSLEDTALAIAEVFDLLTRHVAEGEVDHLRHALPSDIRTLWP